MHLTSERAEAGRFYQLDGLRGIGAIVVATGHFFYGFAPELHASARNTPLFSVFNGTAAVVFFFILSGFVLSVGALSSGEYAPIRSASIRRWPRLAGPVLLTCLLSAAIGQAGLYANAEAGALSKSGWLSGQSLQPGDRAAYLGAVWEGLVSTFWMGERYYNPVLWTMYYEFFGSFLVFGLTAILIAVKSSAIGGTVLVASFSISFLVSPFFSCFVLGVGVAFAYALGLLRVLKGMVSIALSAVLLFTILYLWGFGAGRGLYSAFSFFGEFQSQVLVVHAFSGVLLIVGALCLSPIRLAFSGPVSRALGKLSFPIYLSHMLVIASVSSILYVNLSGVVSDKAAFVVVAFVTILLTGALSWSFMLFDEWFQRLLKRRGRLPTA